MTMIRIEKYGMCEYYQDDLENMGWSEINCDGCEVGMIYDDGTIEIYPEGKQDE